MQLDAHYREEATLRDGRRVTLRCVRPGDKELLRRGFERLSPESRYRRFLSNKQRLSEEELAYLTEVDGRDHFALGATAHDDAGREIGVGIARFVRSADDPLAAEPAIAVADDWQGDGLGTLLLHRLVAAARERGIRRFEGLALAGNAPLLEILEPLGSGARVARNEGQVAIRVDLPRVPETLPDASPARRPKSPLERLLALAARELLAMATRLGRRRDAADDAPPDAAGADRER